MKARTILLLLASLAVGDAFAQVNALPPTRHILVYGDAQTRAIPDRFKITLNFESVNIDPDAARRNVEANVQKVLGQLRAAGVPDNEIVATSLQIDSKERYDDKTDEQVFIGTEVTRKLTARFSKQSELEAFLAGIKTSKELTISDVKTELSDEPALRAALREKTIASSREKADVIAKAYGARISGVYSVSDVAPQFDYGVRAGTWPQTFDWHEGDSGGANELHRVEVTGSRLSANVATSLQTGYVTFQDKIYTVFLLAD